jgi:hypothetical protein
MKSPPSELQSELHTWNMASVTKEGKCPTLEAALMQRQKSSLSLFIKIQIILPRILKVYLRG